MVNLPPDAAIVTVTDDDRLKEIERRMLEGEPPPGTWVIADKEMYVAGLGIVFFNWAITFTPACAFTQKPKFYFGYRSVAGAISSEVSRITESSWTLTNGFYTAVTALVSYAQTGATIVNVTFEGEGIVFV